MDYSQALNQALDKLKNVGSGGMKSPLKEALEI